MAANQRPKRLWVVTVMNVAIGLIGIATVGFLLKSSKIPAEAVPATWSATLSILSAMTLISASILALLGLRRTRWFALVTAVAYFGIILVHNLLIYVDPQAIFGQPISDRDSRKLLAAVIRSSIEIGINVWAYLSVKTGAFFRPLGQLP